MSKKSLRRRESVKDNVPKRTGHPEAVIVQLIFKVVVGMIFLHLVETRSKRHAKVEIVVSDIIQNIAR